MRRLAALAVAAAVSASPVSADDGRRAFASPTGPMRLGGSLPLPLAGGFAVVAGGEWPAVGLGWQASSPDGRLLVGLGAGLVHQQDSTTFRPAASLSLVVVFHLQ